MVVEELVSRLSVIRETNNFATDAGKTVFVGESPELGEGDPETAIAVVLNDTVPQPNRMEIWPIEIQAVAKASIEQPYMAALHVLGDVVKAFELEDLTLNGLVKRMEVGPQRTLRREQGSMTVGIGQVYYLQYIRAWGTV